MKQKSQWLLLLIAALGIAGCIWAWFFDLRMLLFLPAIPAFFIQVFMCRSGCRRWLRALPLFLVLLYALNGLVICCLHPYDWDGLFGVIILVTSISPAIGCLAGLIALKVLCALGNKHS